MSESAAARVVVVDDEPHARRAIVRALAAARGLVIAGEAGDGVAAVRAIEELHPDLLFLDVQMPSMDGFAVLEAIEPEHRPAVVFVTAFARYAVEAFEVHAVDYVLKPFDEERLRTAARRALERADARGYAALLRDTQERPVPLDRFTVRERGVIRFVEAREVQWIAADGNYVRIHHGDHEHLIRMTLAAVEARARPGTFVRIHRSTLVSPAAVSGVTSRGTGDYTVHLRCGAQLMLSRSHRDAFFALMEGDRTIRPESM